MIANYLQKQRVSRDRKFLETYPNRYIPSICVSVKEIQHIFTYSTVLYVDHTRGYLEREES